MGSLLPLYIPLDRISHRNTPTVKSDLIPWIHIADRHDLSAVFEKETITTKLGYIEQQTVVKIKAGVKTVDTLVLEDLACQAAVQERRFPSSPTSPAHFAIFTSSLDMAFRYRLLDGHFRKIQVLFRYKDGLDSAVKVLESFNLPIIHKDTPSQSQSNLVGNALSTSTRLSMGPPTIFSHTSQSSGTKATRQTQQTFPIARSLTYSHSLAGIDRISSSYQSPTARYTDRIIRPGPSLVEPIVEISDGSRTSRWRSHSEFRSYRDEDMLSKNRDHDIRISRNVLNNRLCTPGIEQSYEPRQRNGSVVHNQDTDTPLSLFQSSHTSKCDDLKEDSLISNQHRLFNNKHRLDSFHIRDTNEQIADETSLLIPKDNVASQAASSAATTVQVLKQNRKDNTAQTKAAPRKRLPKRSFKAVASQTESSSISKSTQTKKFYAYVSSSVQTQSAAPTITTQDKGTQTDGHLQDSSNKTLHNMAQIPKNVEDLINILVTSPLPKRRQQPVNKFGKGRKHVPTPDQGMQNIERLGKSCGGDIHTDIVFSRRSTRGINKFGRTRRKVC